MSRILLIKQCLCIVHCSFGVKERGRQLTGFLSIGIGGLVDLIHLSGEPREGPAHASLEPYLLEALEERACALRIGIAIERL